jgi:hypothetical protein
MSKGAILAIYTHLLMETFNSAYARKGSHERTHNLCTFNFCFVGCMSHTCLLRNIHDSTVNHIQEMLVSVPCVLARCSLLAENPIVGVWIARLFRSTDMKN